MLCTFEQFSKADQAALAGGKGAMLAELFQAGFPVPEGFILLASAFDGEGLLASAREQVAALYRALGAGAVAVRSSGLQEDSAAASFAGEFESVLDVRGEAALFEAIAQVFASSRSERVAHYAQSLNLSGQQRLAIVVQRMLAPQFAGVLFTLDPVSGDRTQMLGNLTEGTGEKLVAGEVTGSAFHLDAKTGAYSGPASFAPFGGELFRLAQELERRLQVPLDLEWAVAEGKLYLLQCRPVTAQARTPEVWNDSLAGHYLWCNTNLGELFCQVITPLTWSVFREVTERQMAAVAHHRPVGMIAGRSYFNLSLICSIMAKMGKSRAAALGDVDLFLGRVPDHIELPLIPLRWGEVLRFVGQQIKTSLKISIGYAGFLKWIQQESPAYCERTIAQIAECRTNQDLLAVFAAFEPILFKTFSVVAFAGNAAVQQQYKLRKVLGPLLPAEDLEIILSGLGGTDQLHSMGPLMGVAAMQKGTLSREDFIRQWGHRGLEEAEYAAPRTAEDPAWIDKLMAQSHDLDVDALLEKQKRERERVWQRLAEQHPKQVANLRKLCAAAASSAQNREQLKSENFRQAWVMRRFAQKVATVNGLSEDSCFYLSKDELLAFLNGDRSPLEKIADRRQTYVAYSSLPAIPNLISGSIDPFQWARDPMRRTDYHQANLTSQVEDEQQLKGFPGSTGIVEGTVRVLASHEQMGEFRTGEILVTSFTNVAWTLLFPRAAAIVTDIGAPLSHAAIVARELGIPAVVGTGSATMKLRTGDRVRVNGHAGLVELLSR